MRWANLVSAVMAEQKVPAKYLVGILAQIQQESWGDPTSVNLWDSNYRRGTPSMGLLQMIAPTYLSYTPNAGWATQSTYWCPTPTCGLL